MTKEMYVADVKNWLMNIANGVKAMKKSVQYAPAKSDVAWKVTAHCYDYFVNGVGIHGIKQVAEAIDVPVKFSKFDKESYLYSRYDGYYYIEMFGIRFYDFGEPIFREGDAHERE